MQPAGALRLALMRQGIAEAPVIAVEERVAAEDDVPERRDHQHEQEHARRDPAQRVQAVDKEHNVDGHRDDDQQHRRDQQAHAGRAQQRPHGPGQKPHAARSAVDEHRLAGLEPTALEQQFYNQYQHPDELLARRGHEPLGRRAPPRRALPPPAVEAGPAAPRRADQPSRHRQPRSAHSRADGLRRRRDPDQPRPPSRRGHRRPAVDRQGRHGQGRRAQLRRGELLHRPGGLPDHPRRGRAGRRIVRAAGGSTWPRCRRTPR